MRRETHAARFDEIMDIRIVLADDHPVVLRGLEALLRQQPGFDVVGKCSDADRVVEMVLQKRPDVVLLDLHMPKKNGLAILRELHACCPEVRVVLLTTGITEEETIEAMRHGVRGILLKEMSLRLVVECIRKVHLGAQWYEKSSISRVVDRMLRREEAWTHVQEVLTRRETEIMRLLAQSLTNEQIAEKLFITRGTVKLHAHAIYKKLRLNGRTDLTNFARDKGLV